MTRADWIADRADVLRETDAIARDIQRVEQQYGSSADVDDMPRRLHAVREILAAQMMTVLPDNGAVH
jgi:hypothetical protein